jgi:deoxyribonuclease V
VHQKIQHPWDLPAAHAKALQARLAEQVILKKQIKKVRYVGGVDVGLGRDTARAAMVVLAFPDLTLVDQAAIEVKIEYPYVPGLLTFREGPAVLEALSRIKTVPDVVIFDGQGIAHPRRLGIASHIGVLTGLATIGCAKTRLIGRYDEPGREKGAHTLLRDDQDVIGAVVRTRTGVKPMFVSPGHRVDLDTSIDTVLACCTRYRLPETTRIAHQLASG